MQPFECQKKTKIVATFGPAVQSPEALKRLVESGVDIVRYNFSHGTPEGFHALKSALREIEGALGRPVGLLADLCGPKIRTGRLPEDGVVELVEGCDVRLFTGKSGGDQSRVPVTYDFQAGEFPEGTRILLDDGKLVLRVTGEEPGAVVCAVDKGGPLRSHKGVNFPGVATHLPALTEKDKADAATAADGGADFIALSFVRRAEDIRELRDLVRSRGADPFLVAKIEKPQALENLDAILRETDGVMVARGDLGVEIAIERIGLIQKEIIRKCREWRKPVITATQMLESMTEHPSPTRAEATDVANAVLDGTDAVMLSEETATGAYPIEAVKTMAAIVREAEQFQESATGHPALPHPASRADCLYSICHAAVTATLDLGAGAVMVHTLSGRTAHVISRFRPAAPVVAFTPETSTWRKMSILYGVTPVMAPALRDAEDQVETSEKWIRAHMAPRSGVHFVVVSGAAYTAGATNAFKVVTV